MKGKLVRYQPPGSEKYNTGPLALVVDSTNEDSLYHWRIRVSWLGDETPVQASSLSIKKRKITTWVKPENFIIIE